MIVPVRCAVLAVGLMVAVAAEALAGTASAASAASRMVFR